MQRLFLGFAFLFVGASVASPNHPHHCADQTLSGYLVVVPEPPSAAPCVSPPPVHCCPSICQPNLTATCLMECIAVPECQQPCPVQFAPEAPCVYAPVQPYLPMVCPAPPPQPPVTYVYTPSQPYCPAPCPPPPPPKVCPSYPYGRAEFLLWWTKGTSVPPLVTTSATQQSLGRLDAADTRVLVGGSIGDTFRQGGRFTLGYLHCEPDCQGCCCCVGIEGNYFFLGQQSNNPSFFSFGDPVLARPFVNAVTGQQFVEQVANQQITDANGNVIALALIGGVQVFNRSRVWGGEANGFYRCVNEPCRRIDLLVGYRHLYLNDFVGIREDLQQPPDPVVGGAATQFVVMDNFGSSNNFSGGQIGARGEWHFGDWYCEATGKVALGNMHQTVSIQGSTQTAVAGQATTIDRGGLLALETNIGDYSRNRFAVVPEAQLNVGCFLTERLRLYAGYTFLYCSSVVRAGEQIDITVNPGFLPPVTPPVAGLRRPAFQFNDSDFWIQGLQFGMELTY